MRKLICCNCEDTIYEEAVVFEYHGNVRFFCCKSCFHEWIIESGLYKDIVEDFISVERILNLLDNRPRMNYKTHSRVDI